MVKVPSYKFKFINQLKLGRFRNNLGIYMKTWTRKHSCNQELVNTSNKYNKLAISMYLKKKSVKMKVLYLKHRRRKRGGGGGGGGRPQ